MTVLSSVVLIKINLSKSVVHQSYISLNSMDVRLKINHYIAFLVKGHLRRQINPESLIMQVFLVTTKP